MPQSTFGDLYHASYRNLAAQISAYLGDPAEAEDVVQEAYLRTWQRWDSISGYEDPPAYLRRVAWNLATSRWRKLVTAARHLRGQRVPEAEGGPQPDRVALVAALRQSGRTAPLILTQPKFGLGSPIYLAQVRSPAGEVICPARTIQFDLEREIMPGQTALTDLDGDGDQEIVVQIRCGTADSIFYLVHGAHAFETAQVVFANDGTRQISPEGWTVEGNILTLKLDGGETLTLTINRP